MHRLLTAAIWTLGFLIAFATILGCALAIFLWYIVPIIFQLPGRVIGWTGEGSKPCPRKL